ncbi:MAG: ATP-grasp domain-containing protein [Candidatus Endonucleobacter bathymodioli]|uniref:ATP-grasp domain-containing protein n=1 Tax=Candidatus Endonucleibacter bathymodioli TaxID=539814 RepID=A0AA90NUH9_9GAMM|nr:ATP-grasp domain-containing protein [Candidatus Endonucleobacter bathymodioli]
MSNNKFGFLSPQPYMEKALVGIKKLSDIVVLEPKGWDDSQIDEVVAICKKEGVSAVAGFAQKDAFNHILINEKLGNKVPSKMAFLYCMNKYLMRTLEKDSNYYDWVDPSIETNEQIVDKIKEWPFMLKNTSLSLGRGVFKIETKQNLIDVLNEYRADTQLQSEIEYNYTHFKKGIPDQDLPEIIPPFIAEHYMDINRSIEYCYEGYVGQDGKIVHYALTEEVYFSNHQALGYITPTISVDKTIAKKVEDWIDDYMGRLSDLGYKNQFFNIEFWITDDGKISLVEINPRAAHSYHYNYELSFKNSLFNDNFKLAAGLPIADKTPWLKWKDDETTKYTLIVLITAKETGKVGDIADYDYINKMYENNEIDVVRYTKKTDDILKDSDMTSAGVMLMQLWVSGSKEEVIAKEIEIRKNVYRHPNKNIVGYPEYWKV